jgi:hypothetical protein
MRKRLLAVLSVLALLFVVAGLVTTLPSYRRQRNLEAGLARVEEGMTREQVEALVGPPAVPPARYTWSNPDARPDWVAWWGDGSYLCCVTFSEDWRVTGKSEHKPPTLLECVRLEVARRLGW